MAEPQKSLMELIRKTSTELPEDILQTLKTASSAEGSTNTHFILDSILKNCDLAKKDSDPICQDTGSILFYVKAPKNFDTTSFKIHVAEAVADATSLGLLRQNLVDTLTGENTENNLGVGSPYFEFEIWEQNNIEVRLMLKGGGSENVSTQYSLPDKNLKAERNLDGVKKCLLDAVLKAQGLGCAPGIIGVCIGGDRTSGYAHAKRQLLRNLADNNDEQQLAKLEKDIVTQANKLQIGPMGLGGSPTLLACKIGVLHRIPASYFVSVSYMCWASRRQGVLLNDKFEIMKWLY